MCEILVAVWPEPAPLAEVLPWAACMERYGLGGFGWGVAWREAGGISVHRYPGPLAEDQEGRDRLATVRSTHFMVHLRRPSNLTTVSLADTQPFLAEDRTFAFEHNGRLDGAEAIRQRFSGRLQGRADSEVGFRLFERLQSEGMAAERALGEVHRQLGGTANLACLQAAGPALVYAGAPANQMWRFAMGDAVVASTALHSGDQAVFDLCFPGAREREAIATGSTVQLNGPTAAGVAVGPPGPPAEAHRPFDS